MFSALVGEVVLCVCLAVGSLPGGSVVDGGSPVFSSGVGHDDRVGVRSSVDGLSVVSFRSSSGGVVPAMSMVGPRPGQVVGVVCPGNPLCGDLEGEKLFEWLPLWRWTRATWLFSDIDADTGWLARKVGIGNVADLVVGLVVQLPLQIAGLIWEITSYLLYLALNPVFYVKLFYHAYDKAVETWTGVFRPLLLGGGVTVWVTVLVIGIFVVLRKLLRAKIANSDTRLPWVKTAGEFMHTLVPLALAFMMLAGVPIGGQSIPAFIMSKTQESVEAISQPIRNGANALTASNMITARDTPTSCGAYIGKLEDIFRAEWKEQSNPANAGWRKNVDDVDGGELSEEYKGLYTDFNDTEGGSVRQELPILASRMWEKGFYHGLGMAQFGDRAAALRATCFLTEWRVKSTTAAEQQAVFDLTDVYPNTPRPWTREEYLRAEDRLHPDGTDAERALLNLAAACILVTHPDHEDVPSSTNPVYRYVTTNGEISENPRISLPIHPKYDPGTGKSDRAILKGRDGTGSTPQLDPAWAGMFNNKTRAFMFESNYAMGSDACAEWMDPTPCPPVTCKWDTQYVGATSRDVTGVRSEWLQNKANITVADMKRSLETRRTMTANGPAPAGTPGDVDVARVGEIVRTVQGLNVMKRVLFAVVTLLTALVFLYSLGGLTLGVLLAQIILALTLILMPVLLLVSAFPHDGARKLQKKLIRVWIAASLSYAIFFTTLAVLMLIITLVDDIATSVIPTSDGGLLDILITPFVALLSVKLLKSIAKTLGADITSFKGALQFTSGMTAAGVELPDPKAFARDTMSPLTSSFQHTKQAAGHATRAGQKSIKAARTVNDSWSRGREQARKDGHQGIGAFAHGLKEAAIDGYKESIARPLNLKTMSNHQKWKDKLSLEALDYNMIEQAQQEWEDKDTARQQLAEKRTMINGAKRVMKEYEQGQLPPLPPSLPSQPQLPDPGPAANWNDQNFMWQQIEERRAHEADRLSRGIQPGQWDPNDYNEADGCQMGANCACESCHYTHVVPMQEKSKQRWEARQADRERQGLPRELTADERYDIARAHEVDRLSRGIQPGQWDPNDWNGKCEVDEAYGDTKLVDYCSCESCFQIQQQKYPRSIPAGV